MFLLSFACPKESYKENGTRGEQTCSAQVKLKIRNSYPDTASGYSNSRIFLTLDLHLAYPSVPQRDKEYIKIYSRILYLNNPEGMT